MAIEWEQVVVDAKDPVALGRWWADVLEWVVVNDAPDEFEIRPSIDRMPGLIFEPVSDTKRDRMPRSAPESSNAASSSASASLPWAPAVSASVRSSTHRTGRRSRMAASAAHRYSGSMTSLPPNAPPMAGQSTRTWLTGRPSAWASAARLRCGICVDRWQVSSAVAAS